MTRQEEIPTYLRFQRRVELCRVAEVIFNSVSRPQNLSAFTSNDCADQLVLHLEWQAGGETVHIKLVGAFYFLGVAMVDSQPAVALERRSGPRDSATTGIVAFAPLELPPDSTIYLRIRARGGSYDFFYAYRPDAWILLKGNEDGTILSTRVAGGFVGTMLGLYAYHPQP